MLAGVLGLLLLPLYGWLLGPGDLDTSFGGTGMIRTPLYDSEASTLALQSDSQILAAGNFDDDLGLARWLSNGTLYLMF
jgi:hypothetical protein